MPSVTMPRLSDSMVDGTIITWLRADGEEISAGEEIVEIETDKAIMPFQAEFSGTLVIVAREGELVQVGSVIAHIGVPDAVQAHSSANGTSANGGSSGASSSNGSSPTGGSPNGSSSNGTSSNGRVNASPVAKRMAAALGLDLAVLSGTGPGGRIVKRDVQGAVPPITVAPAPPVHAATAMAAPAGAADRGSVQRVPLSPTQTTIARRMVQAKNEAPEFTVAVTADVTELVELRARLAAAAPERKPSPGDFVIKAVAQALREHPRVNAGYVADAVELYSRVNIGVAVAAEQSLLVPTLYDADLRPLGQIAEAVRDLAGRAREGRLTPAEMSNATFTVSNLGMFGVSHFTAVLNPPQAAILAVGAAEQQVVVLDGQFVARRRMTLTLTADHRVIYGADAAMFLASVRDGLENPLSLVL